MGLWFRLFRAFFVVVVVLVIMRDINGLFFL